MNMLQLYIDAARDELQEAIQDDFVQTTVEITTVEGKKFQQNYPEIWEWIKEFLE